MGHAGETFRRARAFNFQQEVKLYTRSRTTEALSCVQMNLDEHIIPWKCSFFSLLTHSS